MSRTFRLVALGEALSSIEAGHSPDLQDTPARDGEWGVLKVSAIQPEGLKASENKAIHDRALIHEWLEVKEGDLLITRANTDAFIGTACIARKPRPHLMLCDKVLRLVVNQNYAIPEFVCIVLSHDKVRNQLRASASGTSGSMKNISQKSIKKLTIPLPSLTEQRQIAEILDVADKQISRTEAVITKRLAIESALSNLAWEEIKKWSFLAEIATVESGLTLGSGPSGPSSVELPYLRVANVQDGHIDTREMKTVRVLRNQVSRYAVETGDVLLTEGGDFDKLGRGAVWDGHINPCLHQNHIFRIRCRHDLIIPEYLALYTASRSGRRYFLSVAKQTTNLASINSTQLKAMLVPLPPLSEQERMLRTLRAARSETAAERATLEKLRMVKKGLMDDLLTGRVCVGEPRDERTLYRKLRE